MGFQFIDDKGRFLGRTGASWAKILTFYAVYYTFLACLIYFTVTLYADNLDAQPGKMQPKIVTRVDQPGAAIYPFQDIDASIDQDGELNLLDKDAFKAYNKALSDLAIKYDQANADENVRDCGNSAHSPEKNPCKIDNAKKLSDVGVWNAADNVYSFDSTVSDKKPLFAITINKLINWTPISSQNLVPGGGSFQKNSVQFDCFEFDPKVGRVEGNFNIDFLGTDHLASQFFPYTAADKVADKNTRIAYNKPVVVGQISAANDDAWTGGKKQFRCHVLADNIDRPLLDSEITTEEQRSWSTDLTGLKVGFVQFGYSFDSSAEE